MHIAIFVDFHDSTVGGVQTSVRGQRKGLELLGHTVTIVSPPPVKGIDDDPSVICVPAVPFVRPNGFPLIRPSRAKIDFIVNALQKRPKIDIIHVQTNIGIGMLAPQVAKVLEVPLIQTMHGRDDVFAESYPFPYLTTLGSRLIHRHFVPHKSVVPVLADSKTAYNAWQIMVQQAQAADYVVMPSHHFADKFRVHGVTRPIEVISNGLDDEVVGRLSSEVRQLHAKPKVMWCGRLSSEKRPIDAIEMVMAIPGASIDLYGDGPQSRMVGDYIVAKGYQKRASLKGRVDQKSVLKAMQQHDALLYPSFGFDNQPMVLLEAVAAAIPVVYCDPDLTECMPEKGALKASSMGTESMTEALRSVLNDPRVWTQMHRSMLAERRRIVQSYHSKKMVTLYRRVIKAYKNDVV